MLIFKREIYDSAPEVLESIPWQFTCPGCGKTIYVMTEIPYRQCWNCSTIVTTGTSIIAGVTPAARVNYHNVGWPLNDRHMDKVM